MHKPSHIPSLQGHQPAKPPSTAHTGGWSQLASLPAADTGGYKEMLSAERVSPGLKHTCAYLLTDVSDPALNPKLECRELCEKAAGHRL